MLEEQTRTQIQNSARTQYVTYRTLMNPDLTHPDFYAVIGESDMDEKRRIATTRFRLSSHTVTSQSMLLLIRLVSLLYFE